MTKSYRINIVNHKKSYKNNVQVMRIEALNVHKVEQNNTKSLHNEQFETKLCLCIYIFMVFVHTVRD